jgi:sugar lactone lactonase YvrE
MGGFTMKTILRLKILALSLLLITTSYSLAQKIETKDGLRIVHNEKEGKWGKNPELSIEYVKNIGNIESLNENVLFYMPVDIAFDSNDNIYILDSGNHRIQKFDADGKYLATFGRQGEGPGEFQYPISLNIDTEGYLYISDPQNQRIQILKPNGAEFTTIPMHENPAGKTKLFRSGQMLMAEGQGFISFGTGDEGKNKELPKLLKVLDSEGKVSKDFGEKRDYKDFLLNRMGNQIHFTIDKNDFVYIAFDYQNRIEKYSPEGKLLWRADRTLNYDTDKPKNKGSRKASGGGVSIQMPDMNYCSSGVAVDYKGRIWVSSFLRQIEDNEKVNTSMRVTMGAGGRNMSKSVSGNTDVQKTDMYQLEVYSTDGVLLGAIPLTHFVDDIRINKDRIFLLDEKRGMLYREYRIIDN